MGSFRKLIVVSLSTVKKIDSLKSRYVECRYLLSLSGWGTEYSEKDDTMKADTTPEKWEELLNISTKNRKKYRWHQNHCTQNWSILQFLFQTRTASGRYAYHPNSISIANAKPIPVDDDSDMDSDADIDQSSTNLRVPATDVLQRKKHASGTQKLESMRLKRTVPSTYVSPARKIRRSAGTEVREGLSDINNTFQSFNTILKPILKNKHEPPPDHPLPLWHQAYYMIAEKYPVAYRSLGANVAFKLVDFLQIQVPGIKQCYGEILMFMEVGPFQGEFVEKICRELKEHHEREDQRYQESIREIQHNHRINARNLLQLESTNRDAND
ncbi:hypothetical protein NHQ30_011377 [Ciborinia camelliae]|nr:hypothetical protein NHQ30_011377 [Ciborinia camelliae]